MKVDGVAERFCATLRQSRIYASTRPGHGILTGEFAGGILPPSHDSVTTIDSLRFLLCSVDRQCRPANAMGSSAGTRFAGGGGGGGGKSAGMRHAHVAIMSCRSPWTSKPESWNDRRNKGTSFFRPCSSLLSHFSTRLPSSACAHARHLFRETPRSCPLLPQKWPQLSGRRRTPRGLRSFVSSHAPDSKQAECKSVICFDLVKLESFFY